jgi:molybdopterin/thiamine biosynthesis adenylyltransferase
VQRHQTPEDREYSEDRDAALKIISWFSMDRVRNAKVLVVGAGAIGNEVLKNLALLGVGNIYIFDRDTIEMSNLSRSVLFRARDNGHPKAIRAARSVVDLNPNVCAYYKVGDLSRDLGEGFIANMDAVIGCLDSLHARFLLNRLCFRAGTPWIDAGIGTLNGNVTVYRPPDGPCYECDFVDDHRKAAGVHPCNVIARELVEQGRVPTTPTIASVVAGIQVQEFLKLLAPGQWEGRDLVARAFHFYGDRATADSFAKLRSPTCLFPHESVAAGLVIPLPELKSSSPLSSLWAAAVGELGPNVELRLRKEFVLSMRCSECTAVTPVLRPFNPLYEDYRCGKCKAWPRSEANLNRLTKITSSTDAALFTRTLYDLGVPPYGVVEAWGEFPQMRYFALSGDAEDFSPASVIVDLSLPSGATFKASTVPASLSVHDVIGEIISAASLPTMTPDGGQLKYDLRWERKKLPLNPLKGLAEQGVSDGDTLRLVVGLPVCGDAGATDAADDPESGAETNRALPFDPSAKAVRIHITISNATGPSVVEEVFPYGTKLDEVLKFVHEKHQLHIVHRLDIDYMIVAGSPHRRALHLQNTLLEEQIRQDDKLEVMLRY